jgi:hypothetical protein
METYNFRGVKMKQTGTQKFMSEDGSICLICNNDVSLGALHDFLLNAKGHTVDLISAAQKQERDAAEAVKKQDAEKAEAVEEVKAEEQK